jgi:hypothetical protein
LMPAGWVQVTGKDDWGIWKLGRHVGCTHIGMRSCWTCFNFWRTGAISCISNRGVIAHPCLQQTTAF